MCLEYKVQRPKSKVAVCNTHFGNWTLRGRHNYFEGDAAAAGGLSGSRPPPRILITSLLITNTSTATPSQTPPAEYGREHRRKSTARPAPAVPRSRVGRS